MRLPLLLLAFSAANAVAATGSQFAGITGRSTNTSRAVRDYLDRLVSISKNVITHELMGPKVGSDVNPSPSPSQILRIRSTLTFLFFVFSHSQVSLFPFFLIQSTRNIPCFGSGMGVERTTHGLMNSACPYPMTRPSFSTRWWMTPYMLLSEPSMLSAFPEMFSQVD
jgi:hypothetical protein